MRAAFLSGVVELLAFVGLHQFLDFGFDGIQVEGSWILHRRIVDCRHREFTYRLLYYDEAPKLARHEVVHVAAATVVQTPQVKEWNCHLGLFNLVRKSIIGYSMREPPGSLAKTSVTTGLNPAVGVIAWRVARRAPQLCDTIQPLVAGS